jgi:putative DNA primase/helicase
MNSHDFQNWANQARAVPIERELDRRGIKLRRVGLERVGPCPKCGGDDRFAINAKKAVWNCRGCGVGGDIIQLVEHLDSVDFNTACTRLTGQPPPKANGKDTSKNVVVAEFEYHDENGSVAFAVDRIQFQKLDGSYVLKDGKPDKAFRQRRPDPDRLGRWIPNKDGAPVVPYRLPQVIEAIAAGHSVFIAEGEAKADLLWSWNVAATCCAGGAKKWKPQHSECLRDADVILLPDNDNAGWEHINKVGVELVGIAKRIRVLVLPDAKAKDDIIDWAGAGGTRERLDALLNEARDWRPPAADAQNEKRTEAKHAEDELIENLAKLQGLEFARERKRLAHDLGVNLRDIDDEVKAHREKVAPLYGHWITEPWPEPVDGDSLLRDIIRRICCHVVITDDGALTIALWIMLSWVHDEIAIHSPILNINSAEPESGKSTTMGLIAFLMPKCIASVEASEAPLYRAIKRWQPSFAFDEFDNILADDDKAALRSVINSGHTRGQAVLRCVTDDHTPELFSTFAPKAIGMCGRKLPPPTLSRCIFVELRRRRKDEHFEKFKHVDDSELADLRRRLRRWAMDNEDTLRNANPSMPDELQNRRADNWRIQFAIADLAGLDWGDKARAAATKIEGKADNRTIGVRLLADIKALFDADPEAHCMHSATIVAGLAEDPEKPWAEFTRGKPLTQNRLAKLLGTYEITSQTVTPPGLKDAKGYYRSQFEDVWSYYLS